jgi:hypothetical protein
MKQRHFVVDEIRRAANRALVNAPKGEAARIADEAGISRATLSRFRHASYDGDNVMVAERLAKVLRSRETADAISSGRARLNWLIMTKRGLRLVKSAVTLEKARQADPDATIFRVWFDLGTQEILTLNENEGSHERQ